jgi:hypothetical protein
MLQNILLYGELAASLYLMLIAVLMEVKNFKSGLLFKFIPFIMGLLLALDFLFRIGVMIVR